MSEQEKNKSIAKDSESQRIDLLFERAINLKTRTLYLHGSIGDEIDAQWFDCAMSELESISSDDITLSIMSPGGDVYEALAILGRIKRSPNRIITEGYGQVMSAATILLPAGHIRRMSKYCTFMIHQSSVHAGVRKTKDLQEFAAQMEKEERVWAQWMADLTNNDPESWYKWAKKKDHFMYADECLKEKVVDELF